MLNLQLSCFHGRSSVVPPGTDIILHWQVADSNLTNYELVAPAHAFNDISAISMSLVTLEAERALYDLSIKSHSSLTPPTTNDAGLRISESLAPAER